MKVGFKNSILVLIITLALCEVVSRYFIHVKFNAPIWQSSRIIYAFYPELQLLPDSLNKGKINILILGGSAVTDTLSHISRNVTKELNRHGLEVDIFNLSQFAHTSFDSRIKFKHCKGLNFNYVFVYDGINDTRANNCPENIFREDYSHIHFYSQVNIFERHPEIKYFTLPFVLDYCWNELKIKLGWKKTIPKEYFVVNEKLIGSDSMIAAHNNKENLGAIKAFINKNRDKVIGSDLMIIDSLWWAEGVNIKSAKSFRNNLLYIYRVKCSETKLILTEYAWYQPLDYSLKKFLYTKMDYAQQRWPTELFGDPQNVIKGINCHNRIIDSIVREHPDIVHFNLNDSIPHNGNYFDDICHLADSGQVLLGTILSKEIIQH